MFPAPQVQEMAFGCLVNQPKHKEGFVPINEISALAKECGVVDDLGHPIDPGVLPVTGFARYNGEKWHLRIESPVYHNVGGTAQWACRWVFSLAAGGADPNR